MATAESLDFRPYLQSLFDKYQYWWTYYTLTDVVGQQPSQAEEFPSPFDFGLMVETVQSKRREKQQGQQEKKQEQDKTERLPVLEGIRKYAADHVLLIGRPGSGKTTSLIRLLLEEAKQASNHLNSPSPKPPKDCQIPVLIELRYFQKEDSVLGRIQAFLHRHHPTLDANQEMLKSWLLQGRLLLLFDGLNELSSSEARQKVRIFRQDYPKTPMIFTTRELGFGGSLGIDKSLEMQPLTERQMRNFVQAYLPELGEPMLRQLGDRLREFGQTPLLLWMLCELFKQIGKIPPNLGLVFRTFTQTYERRLKEDVPVSSESRRWWSPLLQHLAFVMMQGETPTEFRVAIPRQEAETALTEFLQDRVIHPPNFARCCLDDLLKHHLIQAGSSDQIEFRHQLLQEYYAAEYLLQQINHLSDQKLKHDYLNYLKWTEPLALMLTLMEQESQAVRVVQLALEVDLKLGARLAGAVQADIQARTVGLIVGLDIPPLLKIEFLGCTSSEYAIESLSGELSNEDPNVRMRAAEGLIQIGLEAAIPSLTQALNDEESYIRRIVAENLAQMGSEAAIPALTQALKDKYYLVFRRAAEGLAKIGSEAAIAALTQALNDEDYYVRLSAAEGLTQMGSEAAIAALNQALKDETSDVRRSAAWGLAQMGSEAAIAALNQA